MLNRSLIILTLLALLLITLGFGPRLACPTTFRFRIRRFLHRPRCSASSQGNGIPRHDQIVTYLTRLAEAVGSG